MSKIIHYYVEGKCEEKLINVLRTRPIEYLMSGKVTEFNFINKIIDDARLRVLDKKAIIVLVYDIDVDNTKILEANINKLKRFGFDKIYHIQSIRNFEDEIVFSTNLTNINNLFKTQGKDEFKREFIHCSNIIAKLNSVDFNMDKMWSRENKNLPFKKYSSLAMLKAIRNK